MSRQDNIRHQHELDHRREVTSQSGIPRMRQLVLLLRKDWKRLLLFIGASSLLDIVKEFVRGKVMDQAYEHLGGLGQWLKAYPVAFFTLALAVVILIIVVGVIKESRVTESSAIYDERGVPYQKQPITRAWIRGFTIAAAVCVGIIAYGTYRYYQISVGHFNVNQNTNVTMPDLAVLQGRAPASTPIPTLPPSLIGLFTQDFPGFFKPENDISMEGIDLSMKQQVYLDFIGKSKFVGFYVPASDPISGEKTYKMCKSSNLLIACKPEPSRLPVSCRLHPLHKHLPSV